MNDKQTTYIRLPGRGASLMLQRSLWQGSDHLLWVERSMAQEQYKRFYYKDIQAVILRKNSRQHIWTAVWGLSALLFGVLALTGGEAAYVGWPICALFLIYLLVNFLLGPGCAVYLQTAVQLERLSNLVRIPSARKTVERIKFLAEKAQGAFDPGGVSQAQAAAFAKAGAAQRKTPHAWSGQSKDNPLTPYSPTLHRMLFGLLLAAGLLRIAQTWLKSMPLMVVDVLCLIASLVLAIIVLVRWQRHARGTLLSFSCWAALVLVILHGLTKYIIFILGPVLQPGMAFNEFEMFKLFWANVMGDHPTVSAANIAFAIASTALGGLGLIALLSFGNPSTPKEDLSVAEQTAR